MANNICRLSILLDIPEWKSRSGKMISSLSNIIIQHPTSFGAWALLLIEIIDGIKEVVVIGRGVFYTGKTGAGRIYST